MDLAIASMLASASRTQSYNSRKAASRSLFAARQVVLSKKSLKTLATINKSAAAASPLFYISWLVGSRTLIHNELVTHISRLSH